MECRQFKIEGLVQGVFYRANTEKIAKDLGLTGWVRNTEDGGVECVACGSSDKLESFALWLKRGPERAKVTKIDSKKIDYQEFAQFKILY